jgi:endo-1,4-beta-xylanase
MVAGAAPGAAQAADTAGTGLTSTAAAAYSGPYKIAIWGTNYCLDAEASQIRNGGLIQLYTCNGWANQKWYIDGTSLRNGANTSFCLDAEASQIRNGGLIQLYTCNGWANPQWRNNDGSSYRLHNGANYNFCLDAEATQIRNGGKIQLYSCNDLINQEWDILPV